MGTGERDGEPSPRGSSSTRPPRPELVIDEFLEQRMAFQVKCL